MDYRCRHCASDLDAGDVLDHFLKKYKPEKAIRAARQYGWCVSTPIRFDRSIILQGEEGQYSICPDCGGRDPFLRSQWV